MEFDIKSNHYPHLSRGIISETPKAIVGFVLFTSIYVLTYREHIPGAVMLMWISSVLILLALRIWNSISFENSTTLDAYKKQTSILFFVCAYSAVVWGTSSILGLLYAPSHYAYFSLTMITLMVFAAVFSLASFRKIFVYYAMFMMLPQILIFYFKDGTVNTSITGLCLLALPFILLFSKSVHKNHIDILDLNSKLEKAITEVKILQGIIPICSYCKNIRDDEGSWEEMESYISSHSDTKFSHGVCPDCAEKVWAESGLDDGK